MVFDPLPIKEMAEKLIAELPSEYPSWPTPRLLDEALYLTPGMGAHSCSYRGTWVWVIAGRIVASTFQAGFSSDGDTREKAAKAALDELIDYVRKRLAPEKPVHVGAASINDLDPLPLPKENA